MLKTIQTDKIGKLGFGFTRLPRKDGAFDIGQINKMTDAFLESGGTYFDASYSYEGTEAALCESVVKRHPRGDVQLATKLPLDMVGSPEDTEKLFMTSLERLGTDYIDFYLLQEINSRGSRRAEALGVWDYLAELKTKGLIRHMGFSFYGNPKALEKILEKHPDVDFVQLQISYPDWDDPRVQSRHMYEIARKYDLPIIVMGPLKGGLLASELSPAASLLRDADPHVSVASWALRFAAQLSGVLVTISGMNSLEQMTDNIETFTSMKTLSDSEFAILEKAVGVINAEPRIDCARCRHCTDDCPLDLRIPDLIDLYNDHLVHKTVANLDDRYSWLTRDTGKAGNCAGCRVCEGNCRNRVKIADTIVKIAALFG